MATVIEHDLAETGYFAKEQFDNGIVIVYYSGTLR